MPQASPSETRVKGGLALLLALVGGYVDAVGYLVLFQLFIAHMSGNSITMAVGAGEGDWRRAAHHFFPIPVFMLGVATGTALGEAVARRGVRSVFALTLGLEAALLAAFMLAAGADFADGHVAPEPPWHFYLIAAIAVLAMGVQNPALRRVGGAGVRTTYITGMLTDFTEELVLLFFKPPAPGQPSFTPQPRPASVARALLHLSLWVFYLLGGVAGVTATVRCALYSLLGPIAALSGVALYDFARPIRPPPPYGGAPDRQA